MLKLFVMSSLKEEGLVFLLLKILCLSNNYLGFLLLVYTAKFHLVFLFDLAMFQIKSPNFIQRLVLLKEWSKWNRITFHFEIDSNLSLILNLKILRCLLFHNSYALLLKVGHQSIFYAFFTLFSFDFSSYYYFVI